MLRRGFFGVAAGSTIGALLPNQDAKAEQSDVMKLILSTPKSAFNFALHIIHGPFAEGEEIIATDADCSYDYAYACIKGPFPAGEKAIATNANRSYLYAAYIIDRRFPAGEKAISNNRFYAAEYNQQFGTNL
jgi:hypothetical protein